MSKGCLEREDIHPSALPKLDLQGKPSDEAVSLDKAGQICALICAHNL